MTSTVTESVGLPAATETNAVDAAADNDVLAELLIEEISIDGMCGVY